MILKVTREGVTIPRRLLGKATEVAQASRLGDVITDLCTTAAMIAAIELAARWTPLHDWAGVEGGERGSNDPHAVFD